MSVPVLPVPAPLFSRCVCVGGGLNREMMKFQGKVEVPSITGGGKVQINHLISPAFSPLSPGSTAKGKSITPHKWDLTGGITPPLSRALSASPPGFAAGYSPHHPPCKHGTRGRDIPNPEILSDADTETMATPIPRPLPETGNDVTHDGLRAPFKCPDSCLSIMAPGDN